MEEGKVQLETHTLLQIYIEISLRNLLPSHYAFFIHMVFEVKLIFISLRVEITI